MRPVRMGGVDRRTALLGLALGAVFPSSLRGTAGTSTGAGRYRVRLLDAAGPRFSIVANLPVNGDRLAISDEYPAELPALAAQGWPALVSALEVRDASGQAVAATRVRGAGWRLARPCTGRLDLTYIVDFSLFAAASWPSPLESAVADDEHISVSARPLFLTTDILTAAEIGFDTPHGWDPVAPWPAQPGLRRSYRAASVADLTDNMLVFSTVQPDVVSASGFRIQITTMGHWKPLRPLVRRTLQTIISREVALMGDGRREVYNVVLAPSADTGGNAYRQSFVYVFDNPSAENIGVWGNTMAHEIFHYWNYARLRGADYASTQWFQEGFTEYIANLVTVAGGIVTPAAFLAKLGGHVANARRLTTTLEAIGTHKGPPLYSAGALVAFSFDVMIRQATRGRRDIGTFFRNLWRSTNSGARPYAWIDIEAALREAAALDWQAFYLAHIRGSAPLPLDRSLSLAGLRLDGAGPQVVANPGASPEARAVWASLIATGSLPPGRE